MNQSTSLSDTREEVTDFQDFPSTRYRGSKRKILPWLYELFRGLSFETALDVFGGTGSVSYLLKRMGKMVAYNDVLRFNYLIGLALIENDRVKLSDRHIRQLISTPRKDRDRFVEKTFDGIYFTTRENSHIDSACLRIQALNDGTKEGRLRAAVAYYALFQTCLVKRPFNLFHRSNLAIRTANVTRSFGNKKTWDRRFSSHFRNFAEEANGLVFEGKQKCKALNCDATSLPNNDYDLVYLDPPYVVKGKFSETSDYRRCYHFLEGLANYSTWGDLIDFGTNNLRMKDVENIWTNRRENIRAFNQFFERFSKSIIVVSYKKYGIPSVSTLIRLLRRHGKEVEVHTRHYTYALNGQNGDADLNREVVLIGK